MVVRGQVSAGGGANVSDPLFLTEPAVLTARSFNSGSGESLVLNSAFFTIDTEPAAASKLVISEIHYRPANPDTPEEIAISADRDDYEFIELENIGALTLDLSGARFSEGIDFTFPPQTLLAPGGRVVLVGNTAAFGVRYPGVASFGEFGGQLSNDGEQITLLDADGGTVLDFVYNDQLPWPTAPDGEGFSLVLIAPATNPAHADPTSWRPSVAGGGSPGGSDASSFSGDPEALLDYALGAPQGELRAGTMELEGLVYPTFTFPKNLAADDLVYEIEYSTDLISWRADAVLDRAPHGTETWRASEPLDDHSYWRLRVSLRE